MAISTNNAFNSLLSGLSGAYATGNPPTVGKEPLTIILCVFDFWILT